MSYRRCLSDEDLTINFKGQDITGSLITNTCAYPETSYSFSSSCGLLQKLFPTYFWIATSKSLSLNSFDCCW